jgi:hypothetical protein
MAYIPVYRPGTSNLLFKYDPVRRLIEHQERRVKTVVDLAELDREYAAQVAREGTPDEREADHRFHQPGRQAVAQAGEH